MKNPERSWIRKFGALGYFTATVILVAHELLVIRRRRTLAMSVAFFTIVCLIAPTTPWHRGPVWASAQVPATLQGTVSSPTTKVLRPRDYTLTRLITGVSSRDRTRPPGDDEAWASLAGFRVTGHGKPTLWEPVEIAVTDGRGKTWNWVGGGTSHDGDETLHWFLLDPAVRTDAGESRPDNSEWKLRVEFSQTRDFASGDLWTVRKVPVPKKGQVNDYKTIASTNLHGMKVELSRIIPPGAPIGEFVGGDQRKVPRVQVTLSPKRDGIRLDLVKVTDDRGREVNTSFLMSGSGSDVFTDVPDPSIRYYFNLDDLRSDVKTVNLTFALHESEYAEFTAKPTVMAK